MANLIKVTNKNSFTITDYFEGLRYQFDQDDPVNVPLDAAKHIFGVDFPADPATLESVEFRDAVFKACSRRFGWNSHTEAEIKKNRRLCLNISFALVETQVVEVVASNPDMPEPREQKIGKGAKNKFKPRVDELPDEPEDKVEEEEVA